MTPHGGVSHWSRFLSVSYGSIMSVAEWEPADGSAARAFEQGCDAAQRFLCGPADATMSVSAGGIAHDMRRRLRLTATPIPPERLHVTLLSVGGFSGSCPPAVIDTAMRAAGTISIAPFRAEFDRVASFSGSHGQRALVLTGDGDGVAGFMRLQEALRHALMKAGLKLPRQSNSSPHLTMMYENRSSDFAIEPIGWTVSRFVLIDSLVGQSRYVHLGQWFL